MPKLSKEEGQNLVRAFMESWPFAEHLFEEYQDFYTNYLVDQLPGIYNLAIKWEGGTSLEERKKFIKEVVRKDSYHERFMQEHFLEEEFYTSDLESIAKVILEVTHTMAKPFIDFGLAAPVVELSQGLKEVPEYYFKCPNCGEEHAYLSTRSIMSRCNSCKVTLNITLNGKSL